MKIHNKIITLSLSACVHSGYWGYADFPEETALDQRYQFDGKVIIIGAGASGLAAARILEENKIDYQIIEATYRYGGRIKKNITLADFSIDIGAEWIHNFPYTLNALKGKQGDQIEEVLIPYYLEDAYNWDGEEYKRVSGLEAYTTFQIMPEYKFKNTTWYDYISKNFAKKVKHKIKFNSPVKEIDYKGEKIKIKTNSGEVYEADKVLVTVSIGVLKNNMISFVPQLSNDKKEAINAVRFLPGFKLFMKFDEKFYPDLINCEVETGEKVFYNAAFGKEAQSNILGLLAMGSSAQAYYQLGSDQKIVTSVLRELDQIFDGEASAAYSGDYVLENWGQHEFTLGTWAEAFLNDESVISTLNEPLNDRVYFAGEEHDVSGQYGVHAAILSGYYSIHQLLINE